MANGEVSYKQGVFTVVGILCTNREVLTSPTCLLTIFVKIKSSRKFLNLQQLTHKALLKICSRRQFQILVPFQK